MKIGAYGEIMLRLTPPERFLLEQTDYLRIDYTGTGVNILANLAHFGLDTFILSAVPDNRLGSAAISNLKKMGIRTDYIKKQYHHMGSYIAEMGFGIRPIEITYQNRLNSAFSLSSSATYHLNAFIDEVDLIHICGISLSLTQETWGTVKKISQKAKEKGKKICFDFNYRPSLNKDITREEINRKYNEILQKADIVFGSMKDINALEIINDKGNEDEQIYEFMNYFDLDTFATTKKFEKFDQKYVQGIVYSDGKKWLSTVEKLTSLDRIGTGDAFAAGVLFGIAEGWPVEKSVQFAIKNMVLAHTIQGDVPLLTFQQVEQAMGNESTDINR